MGSEGLLSFGAFGAPLDLAFDGFADELGSAVLAGNRVDLQIERYDLFTDGWGDELIGLRNHPSGEWVKFADHAIAVAAAKREALEEAKKIAAEYGDWAEPMADKGQFASALFAASEIASTIDTLIQSQPLQEGE